MILRIFSLMGSFASLVGLILMIFTQKQSLTTIQVILLLASLALLVLAIILVIVDYYRKKPKSLSKDSQIRDYMFKWISHSGRVAIFSHDMSWVCDDEMRELLSSKAGKDELYLFLPQQIALIDQLPGAHVYIYPELEYVPESRFTIIRKGRMDAQVAVGRKIGSKHVIEEFSAGQHPVFSIANDLTEILMQFNRWKRIDKKEKE
ncbi:MAG: hypothetical protein Q8O10_09395 [candidate division Zixibacteria bacterium]|nr:hypothetical protein [candidate division Zixibacteria bacterium]